MPRIAVTEIEYHKGQAVFEAARDEGMECLPAPAAEHELAAFVQDNCIEHVIIGVEPYREALYAALPPGGVIARFGVGMDGVDQGKAAAHGLVCTNTPGALDDSVAEFTIGLLLAAARHLAAATAEMKGGGWRPHIGCELRNRTLAIVGCGAIGRRVARLAAAFGLRVVGCNPAPAPAEALVREWGFATVVAEFAAAVATADFVSLHLPSVAATRHYVDATRLAQLSPHAWLINTARGAVVDELALYDALAAGRLAGAALDVFEHEPYRPAHPGKDLRVLDNVIMTAHLASSTTDACHRMATAALQAVARLAKANP